MDWDLHDVSGRQRQLLSSFSVRCLRKLWRILCWSVVPAPVARVYPRLSDHSQVAHTNCPSMVTLFPVVFFLSSVTFTWEQKSESDRGKSPRVHCCRKTNPTGGGWLQHLAGTHNFTLLLRLLCATLNQAQQQVHFFFCKWYLRARKLIRKPARYSSLINSVL